MQHIESLESRLMRGSGSITEAAVLLSGTMLYEIGSTKTRRTTDGIKLAAGDEIRFTAGETFAAKSSIAATANLYVHTSVSGKQAFIKAHALDAMGKLRQIDGVAIGRGNNGVRVSDLSVNSSHKDSAAVVVHGDDCRVSNVAQTGPGIGMKFDGAQRLVADMIVAKTGTRAYGIYAGGALTSNCVIKRFDILVGLGRGDTNGDGKIDDAGGMHGIRVHNHVNLVLGDTTLSLPGMNFAGYIKDVSQYSGVAIALKDGTDAKLTRILVDGAIAIGPLPIAYNSGKPGWQTLRTRGTRINGCEINTPQWLSFDPAAVSNYVENSVVRAVAAPVNGSYDRKKIQGACLRLAGGRGTEWPASNGTFKNVKFFGDSLTDTASKPNLKNWNFYGCTFTNAAGRTWKLGAHGELL